MPSRDVPGGATQWQHRITDFPLFRPTPFLMNAYLPPGLGETSLTTGTYSVGLGHIPPPPARCHTGPLPCPPPSPPAPFPCPGPSSTSFGAGGGCGSSCQQRSRCGRHRCVGECCSHPWGTVLFRAREFLALLAQKAGQKGPGDLRCGTREVGATANVPRVNGTYR